MMKFQFLLIAALAVITCKSAVAVTNIADSEFLISFWVAPPMSEPREMRIAEIAEANFTVFAHFCCDAPSVKENLEILDLCKKHGLKAIISDKRVMAKDSKDSEFEKNLDSVVADYSKHSALYGYTMVDEPGPGAFPELGAISQYLLKKDPIHVPYINIFPNYVEDYPWAIGNVPYTEHVKQYMAVVKPALLSYAHYALFDGYERDRYFENLETIRSAAMQASIPWANIILATPHFNYRNPNLADLRWQVYTTLAYGARGIIYFTYWTLGPDPSVNFHNGILDDKGNRTEHYEMVKQINSEIKALAPTLLKLKSTGVYHNGRVPKGAQALPEGTIVKSVKGADMVIGLFEGPNKSKWVMLANRSPRKEARAVVTFSVPRAIVKETSRVTGRQRVLNVSSDSMPPVLNLTFKQGEGRLFSLTASK